MEQLNAAFRKHGSFRESLHTISKHAMLEEGDGGDWKDADPDTTSCSRDTATNGSSDGPPCKHEM